MILGCDFREFLKLSCGQLREAIVERRKDIREHRDAKGDNRCFLDDYLLWRWLADSLPEPHFNEVSGMEKCTLFWKHRRTKKKFDIPKGVNYDRLNWDSDLNNCSFRELLQKLNDLQQGLRVHRDVNGRPRSVNDDRRLYRLLPEKLLADFSLPSKADFLGTAKAPHAGCPAFWKSHTACDIAKCDLHKWGPCR